jgi:hypothetical protein
MNKISVNLPEYTQVHLQPVLTALPADEANEILTLAKDLKQSWETRQIFRTETEMRVGVLDDGRHPTKAAKYWQAVREQNGMLENLVTLSFDMKRNRLKRDRLLRDLETLTDDLDRAEKQIDLEENAFQYLQMVQTAEDRTREIKTWSKIKQELNDGSFDDLDPNTHQVESLHKRLQNRALTLNEHSDPTEVFNIMGQLHTMERLKEEKVLLAPPQEIKQIK